MHQTCGSVPEQEATNSCLALSVVAPQTSEVALHVHPHRIPGGPTRTTGLFSMLSVGASTAQGFSGPVSGTDHRKTLARQESDSGASVSVSKQRRLVKAARHCVLGHLGTEDRLVAEG